MNEYAVSPDARQIAFTSNDNSIHVLNLFDGTDLKTYKGHNAEMNCLVFSRTGQQLITGSNDHTVKTWRVPRPKNTQPLPFRHLLSPDQKHLVSVTGDGTVEIRDAQSGNLVRRFCDEVFTPHNLPISHGFADLQAGEEVSWIDEYQICTTVTRTDVEQWGIWGDSVHDRRKRRIDRGGFAAFAPDSKHFVSGSQDGPLLICDILKAKPIRVLSAANSDIQSVTFSPLGSLVAAANSLGRIYIWNTKDWSKVRCVKESSFQYSHFTFSSDEQRLIVFGKENNVVIFDIDDRTKIEEAFRLSNSSGAFAYSPIANLIAYEKSPSSIRILDVNSGKEISSIDESGSISTLQFDSTGTKLLVLRNSGELLLKDTKSGEIKFSRRVFQNTLGKASFSGDGQRIIITTSNGTVEIWDTETGAILLSLDEYDIHNSQMGLGITIPSNEKKPNSTNNLVLDTIGTDEIAVLATENKSPVSHIQFSSDGQKLFARLSDENWVAWEVLSCQSIEVTDLQTAALLKFQNDQSQAYSKSGRWFAEVVGYNIKLVDLNYHKISNDPYWEHTAKFPSFHHSWHLKSLYASIEEENWYAVAFHFGWLLNIGDLSTLSHQLDDSVKELLTKHILEKHIIPPILLENLGVAKYFLGDYEGAIPILAHLAATTGENEKNRDAYFSNLILLMNCQLGIGNRREVSDLKKLVTPQLKDRIVAGQSYLEDLAIDVGIVSKQEIDEHLLSQLDYPSFDIMQLRRYEGEAGYYLLDETINWQGADIWDLRRYIHEFGIPDESGYEIWLKTAKLSCWGYPGSITIERRIIKFDVSGGNVVPVVEELEPVYKELKLVPVK